MAIYNELKQTISERPLYGLHVRSSRACPPLWWGKVPNLHCKAKYGFIYQSGQLQLCQLCHYSGLPDSCKLETNLELFYNYLQFNPQKFGQLSEVSGGNLISPNKTKLNIKLCSNNCLSVTGILYPKI